MDRTTMKIELLYNEMGKSEKKIADFILKNPAALLPLSITDLAEKSESSEATIVRFAKRLGFSGYQELKITMAKESGTVSNTHDIDINDSLTEIYDKVTNDIYRSLEMTKKVLNPKSFSEAAEAILSAGKVVIFGLGNSASVALDAGHKFFRAGIDCTSYSDNHMQAIAASLLKSGDVAIGISHSGSSKDIVEAMKIAKYCGAKTICITNAGKSPLSKNSDISLFTSSQETEYTILGLNSRIAALSIIDALYSYIVCHKSSEASGAISRVENALKSKKY